MVVDSWRVTVGLSNSVNNSLEIPLIIVNPTSAGGETAKIWARIAADFAANFGAFTVEFTRAKNDAAKIAAEQAARGRRFIIACGGDGTINEVANGIIESGEIDCEMGILPSGTGGDFRRTLDIPTMSAKAAIYLKNGRTKIIDVGRVTFANDSGEQVSRCFLGTASFGLSTKVIETVKQDKPFSWLPVVGGRAAFAWSTLTKTLEMRPTKVLAQVDDNREKELSFVNFVIANARYFGGGMRIAPDAKIDDGFFDVVLIGDVSTARILANSYKLYAGTHLNVAGVHHALVRKITVKPVHPTDAIPFEIDGELPGRLPATFEIVPNAIKLRVKSEE